MGGLFAAILGGLAALGVPLFVLVGAATALCFLLFTDDHRTVSSLLPMVQAMEQLLTRQEFLAIPLFMASGAIMTAGGIAERLVEVAKAGLGWLPGGLAVAAVAACMFFAAISGSSPVTLIAVGSILLPAMVKSNYPEDFGLGLLTTAGSLGCLVPPSISMLIYAISITSSSARVDPQDLFLAGLLPAALIGGMLSVYAIWKGRSIPGGRAPFDGAKFLAAVRNGVWALLLPVLVLGGIYGGLYTPSEAGGVAAAYALFVTGVVYRELTLKGALTVLVESATLMGSLLLIIVLAFGLNEFLADIQIQDKIMELLKRLDLGPAGFLLLVNVLLVVVGALMDSISCTLIFAPMLAPVAYELYGIDPLHFGVVFVINMEIGYLMPPVATNLFVAAAVFKKPFGYVTRAVLPTLAMTCGALVVFMYVPTLSVALVRAQHGQPMTLAFPWDGKQAQQDAADVEAAMALDAADSLSDAPTATTAAPAGTPAASAKPAALDLGAITAGAFADDEGEADLAGPATAVDLGVGPSPGVP
ncbi:MAG: TRAP transporter large permease subunit [Myxococcales bacterium]|nr:TRAP transporter large permease subunit [Myxococcales bacterium]